MSYLDKVQESIHKASIETSRMMSAKLRTEAVKSGWPKHIVRGMHVRYEDGEFTVHAHPEHKVDILNLEYGTPGNPPTAAIRRFGNRQREAEHFLVRSAYRHLKGHK